jgi:hypothetical protein
MMTQGKEADKQMKTDANKEMQEEMVGILTASIIRIGISKSLKQEIKLILVMVKSLSLLK